MLVQQEDTSDPGMTGDTGEDTFFSFFRGYNIVPISGYSQEITFLSQFCSR